VVERLAACRSVTAWLGAALAVVLEWRATGGTRRRGDVSTELNWMQEYAAAETVELGDDGRLSRREMFARLIAICGSAAAATAFFSACASDAKSSAPTAAATATTATSGFHAVAPPTTGGAGHLLSVATDDPDIQAANVSFPGPAGTVFGYLARPKASGRRPGIIVNHEIFGLTDHIRDVARRLAKVGFVALAVDLVSREGGTDKAANVVGALTQGPVSDRVADLDAGVAYLKTQGSYDGQLGTVGFCFGGGMTLSFAAANPDVKAAVSYYGPTPQPPSVMTSTNAAILANYGALDTRVDAGIPDLESAMKGKVFQKHIYAGANHAFNNDTGAAYDEAAAVPAWSSSINWLAHYLR
jgi:carboxymethylenebutenolidase